MHPIDRRSFVRNSMLSAAALTQWIAQLPALAEQMPQTRESNGMLYRTLGKTGERVSAIGLGGYHIGKPSLTEAESIALTRKAIDGGINFMDNCWDYNAGVSEVRMGKALRDGYRQRVFLMTKIDGRTKAAAAQQMEESLRRLQTDHIDLMQLHEVIRLEDPDRAFAADGAMEALTEARQAGKIRFIGFTGHKDPYVHLRMLEMARRHNFHFDTVQMPLNVMDAHFRSFSHEVLPVLVREGIAPLGMKAFGDHFILDSGTVEPMECLHYCLNLPISVQITGIDSDAVLQQALTAARTFRPLSQQQVASILDKTRVAAADGQYELYKTTNHFDGTAHRPSVLG